MLVLFFSNISESEGLISVVWGKYSFLVQVRILYQIRSFIRSALSRNCAELVNFGCSECPQNRCSLGGHKANQDCS